MQGPSPPPRPLRETSRPPGFWLPDDVIELAPDVGEKGLFVYCVLGHCQSLQTYPSAAELAALTGLRETAVWDLLQLLFDQGALNDHDVQAIYVASQKEPVTDGPDQDDDDGGGGEGV